MYLLSRFFLAFIRSLLRCFVVLALVLLAAVGIAGFTDFGARIAAGYIEELASTPQQTVTIVDPSSLLTGRLSVGAITLADSRGVYAEIRGLSVDWSPLALLSHRFDAERVTATSVSLSRLPEQAQERTDAREPFTLPVEVRVGVFDLPEIQLGAGIAGREQRFSLAGSGGATSKSLALKLALAETDRPEAKAVADLAFNPSGDYLRLEADISEPAGGLIAKLLRLPGEPAVVVKLVGDGPLSNWAGRLTAAVDGAEIVALNGRHTLSAGGFHILSLSGGGTVDALMPPELRPLFAGTTGIDLTAAFDGPDTLSVEKGEISTGTLVLSANGTVSARGANDLTARLSGRQGPIDFRWPMATGTARLLINRADVTIEGPATSAALDLDAALAAVDLPQGRAEGVRFAATGAAFDLSARSGSLDVTLEATATAIANADIDRVVRGPVKMAATLGVTPDRIAFDGLTLDSVSLDGTSSGSYDLPTQTLETRIQVSALPDVLPAAVAPRFETPIALAGNLKAMSNGAITLSDLQLRSGTLEAAGSISLADSILDATFTGRLPEIGRLISHATGQAAFEARVTGPLDGLGLTAQLTSGSATVAGGTLSDLVVTLDGQSSADGPAGDLTVKGGLGGQAIDIRASVLSQGGAIAIPTLEAEIGANTLKGGLTLSSDFMPRGTIAFTFPDLSLVSALAGESVAGDISGTVVFAADGGRTAMTLEAAGSSITREALRVQNPAIKLSVADIRSPGVTGTIRAATAAAGENTFENPTVSFNHQGNTTGFEVSARYEDAPLVIEGNVAQHEGATMIALNSVRALVAGFPLDLSDASSVTLRDGTASFDRLVLDVAGMRVALSGVFNSSGESDLTATLLAEEGPAALRLPVEGGEARLSIVSAELRMSGAIGAARLDLSARLAEAAFPQGRVGDVSLAVTSDAVDIVGPSGAVVMRTEIGETGFVNADLARLLPGPLSLNARLAIHPDRIGFTDVTLVGDGLDGAASGFFLPPSGVADVDFRISAPPTALSDALAARVDTNVTLAGKAEKRADGTLALSGFKLASGTLEASGSATLADSTLEATVNGSVLALDKLLADAAGTAAFEATARGPIDGLDVEARLTSSGATLAGRTLSDLVVTLAGKAVADNPFGDLTVTGALDGQVINIRSSVVSQNGQIAIPVIEADIGDNRLKGGLTLSPDLRPEGTVTFDFPDLALLAAMAGERAAGDLAGSIVIRNADRLTGVTLKASGSGISRDTLRIVDPVVDLSTDDLTTAAIAGDVRAGLVTIGANRLEGLRLAFTREGAKTGFDLTGRYDGAPLSARGAVEQQGGRIAVSLTRIEAEPRGIPLRLAEPVTITLSDGSAGLRDVVIGAGSGSIALTGTAGETLDLTARLDALPANLANTFAAGLGAEGTIAGTVTVKGSAGAPIVGYAVNWQGASVIQRRAAGAGARSIRASGEFAGGAIRLDTTLSGGGGLSFSGGGTVGIGGRMPLAMRFSGTLPFSLLAAQLAEQGFVLTGNAAVELSLSGAAMSPVIAGTVSTSGASLVDVRRNLAVNDIAARVSLDGTRATIQQMTGTLASGGRISVTGTVGITAGSNYPANLAIRLADMTYVNGTLVTADVTGDLTVTGPLLRAPVVGGTLRISRAGITIPEKLPASLSEIDIRHKNASRAVVAMNREVHDSNGPTSADSGIGLDITVDAPSRVFVRGRGINAELGGNVTIRGTSASPVVSGAFTLRRGRLEILARRLEFSRGTIGFGGGLVPSLDLTAGTTAGSTEISVTVAGLASNPTVNFASSPTLPQDEILAQLIFNRSMSKLSAVQIAQLAAAVSQLSGGQSGSLLNGLRSQLGVDDLDITTDSEGRAQVSIGKYLNDRTYIELKQDPDSGGGKAVINLEVGRGVKLRGEAGSGGGAAGIFYEKEY